MLNVLLLLSTGFNCISTVALASWYGCALKHKLGRCHGKTQTVLVMDVEDSVKQRQFRMS